MKLKKIHLPIVVAEASDLPLGTLGEFITADTLKPYLDQIATKSTPAQISTAVNALKAELVGTAGISVDTFGEMKTFVDAVQALQQSDKDSILAILATCVKTADIMPIVNAKATKVELHAEGARVEAIANAKTSETRAFEIADYIFGSKIGSYNQHIEAVEAIANSKITDAQATHISNEYYQLANTRLLTAENVTIPAINQEIVKKSSKVELQAEVTARTTEVARVEAIANSKSTPAYVGAEINIARADVRGYIDIQVNDLKQNVLPLLESKAEANASIAILNTAIATKTNSQDVNNTVEYWRQNVLTPQYKGLVDGLRAEMLAIEGIDQTEFTRLKNLLAQLTALESADVTGLNTAISRKVEKSNVLDSEWAGATLNDYVNFVTTATDAQIGSGKIVDAILLHRILAGLKYAEIDTKFAKDHVLDGTKVGTLENFMSDLATIQGNLGTVLNAERIQSFFLQTYVKINSKFAKDHVLKIDSVQGMGHFINAMTVAELEDKVVDGNVLRLLINDLFSYLNLKSNTADAFAKASVLNSTWSTATLASWIAFIDATDAQIGSGKVVDAQILRNILREVVNHSDEGLLAKVDMSRIISTDFFGANTPADYESFLTNPDDSSIIPKKLLTALGVKRSFNAFKINHVDTKADSVNVFSKEQTFNREQIMSGLNERATNARVKSLEDELAIAKQDIETLKSYFE